jgi:hypothetical protein
MENIFFLKLRSNIPKRDDVELARLEIRSFFGEFEEITDISDLSDLFYGIKIDSNVHEEFSVGFLATTPKAPINEIVKGLSFIQEVWYNLSKNSKENYESTAFRTSYEFDEEYVICAIPQMAMSEYLTYLKDEVSEAKLNKIALYLSNKETKDASIKKVVNRKTTSTTHLHGLHKFKARFFPRMIRALINIYINEVPSNENGNKIILDPFVGSGTTLIESYLAGYDSIGIDIDPLSVKMSEAKIWLLKNKPVKLTEYVNKIKTEFNKKIEKGTPYEFPEWISRKFVRWNTLEEKIEYENEISLWRNAINTIEDTEISNLFNICLSDALVKKFNIRMMGTGSGRFALEIKKRKLSKLMSGNLENLIKINKIIQLLKKNYKIEEKNTEVFFDTATKMPIEDENISLIITSPPYLPASSGRENYLIGKSISLTALNLMTEDEFPLVSNNFVGSMKNGSINLNSLPSEAVHLYKWLLNDELRSIKAIPVAMYYQDIKKSLIEAHRTLVPNGLAIYIIGKESVFYIYKTREIIYKVNCDEIFKKIALEANFKLVEQIDIELNKKNLFARPRSKDKFYESIIILKKL